MLSPLFQKCFMYFWERENESRGEADRQGDRGSEAGSLALHRQQRARCRAQIKPMNCEIMTWAKVGSLTDRATGVPHFFHLFFFFTFIYLFFERPRETEHKWGRGRERERERETESEAHSRFWAVSTEPNTGLELIHHETMTWAKVGCLTNRATQVPLPSSF